MGGWGDDSPAEETLNQVRQMVKDLRIDIDTEQAFVPGVRRGYAILPYEPREGEDQQRMRERLLRGTQAGAPCQHPDGDSVATGDTVN